MRNCGDLLKRRKETYFKRENLVRLERLRQEGNYVYREEVVEVQMLKGMKRRQDFGDFIHVTLYYVLILET